MEKGTTRGIVTDIDGKFTLKVAPGATIVVSYLGYGTQTLKATSSMDVVLKEDNALLDEVVVVGYGQQKKANLTGAVSVVDVDKALEGKPQMDVAKSLQGVVPGLSIVNTQGGINSQPSITIRGVGTLSNSEKSDPLIIVDGVPIDDLSLVNPQDIASVSVLKDAASTTNTSNPILQPQPTACSVKNWLPTPLRRWQNSHGKNSLPTLNCRI